jgi:hypothetical protein
LERVLTEAVVVAAGHLQLLRQILRHMVVETEEAPEVLVLLEQQTQAGAVVVAG